MVLISNDMSNNRTEGRGRWGSGGVYGLALITITGSPLVVVVFYSMFNTLHILEKLVLNNSH